MTVSFELPIEIERTLREALGDVGRAAKEALLVDLYRQEKLTHHQLASALGLSRFETDALLKRHEVFYDLTAGDVARESEGLRKLRDHHAGRR
jgi:hypothetical protein